MLFADLKGSMDLGEKVDPEEWYRIMDRRWRIEPALAEAEAWLEMSDAKSYEPACIWSAPSWPV